MPVIPLTIVASLSLVFTFVMFFLRMHAQAKVSSAERDALLPFAEERGRPQPRVPGTDQRLPDQSNAARPHSNSP